MFDWIRLHQLNIMLFLCGACGIITLLMFMTHVLHTNRKRILIMMEVAAFFLLWFDRQAYLFPAPRASRRIIWYGSATSWSFS